MAKIKFRRDTAANWTSANPILAQGEPGFEHDTGLLKIGDGATAWVNLDYNSGGGGLTDDQEVKVTVGNTDYWAMVNRANNEGNNGGNGVESSAVAYDSENNVIMLHISENGAEEAYQPIISKFNNAGTLLWQKQITQSVDEFQTHDLAVDSEDNIYVALTNNNGINGDRDLVILKLDSAGTVLWQKEYHPQDGEVSSRVTTGSMVVRGANIFVTGWYVADTNNQYNRGFLMRASTDNGSLNYFRAFEFFAETEVYGMEVGADGNPVVVGKLYNGESPADGAFVTKFSAADGEGIWTNSIFDGLTGIDFSGGDITVDSQNNVYVSINSEQDIVTDNFLGRPTIAHVIKLNSSGVVQWSRRIGPGPCASVATGIDCDSVGNVYLSALTVAQNNAIRDEGVNNTNPKNVLAIAKYNTAGAVLWQRYIETDHFYFTDSRVNDAPPGFYNANNRGRNLSISTNGKLAVQASVYRIDLDDTWENTNYHESITFQIDQDGREMTVGSGSTLFKVKESRIPGRFVTIPNNVITDPALPSNGDVANIVGVTNATFTFFQAAELAQELTKTAPYEYVFGNDGTFTIPNDGDVKLTQAQLGWFTIFGPGRNENDDIWVAGHCVDPTNGDVYLVGEDDDDDDGFVARFNSQGQLMWSIRLREQTDGNQSDAVAVKLHPTTGNLIILLDETSGDDSTALIEIDKDTAQIVRSAGIRDLGNGENCTPKDFDFLSDGSLVVVGEKEGEYAVQAVTPRTGSTTGLLALNTSDVTGTVDTGWFVSGTGITGRTPILRVNEYSNLATTVRQGSGAVFSIEIGGSGPYTYESVTATTVGSNYRIGHKILVLGTALEGLTPTNDVIITVTQIDGNGGIIGATISGTYGNAQAAPYTYTNVTGANHLVGSGATIGLIVDPSTGAITYAGFNSNGSNYAVDDVLTISGSVFLGGTSPTNDATITVTVVDGAGTIAGTDGVVTGTAPTGKLALFTEDQVNYSEQASWNLNQSLNTQGFIVRTNSDIGSFAIAWSKTVGGVLNNFDDIESVMVDTDDNIYVAGQIYATGNAAGVDLNNRDCAFVAKFSSTGTLAWSKALNDTPDGCNARSVAVRGNTVAVAHENSDSGDIIITKLTTSGAIQWQRRFDANDSECSVAIDSNGDIYAVGEAVMESQYNECVKIIRFTPSGEIVWRKILATQVDDDTSQTREFFHSDGRFITVDDTYVYVAGQTTAFDNDEDNAFLVKFPKTGDCDGVYDHWTLMTDAYDVDKVTSTLATDITVTVATGEFETWEPDYQSQWWDPSNGDSEYQTLTEIRDGDGGAIEFADGTRQTTSAQQIPQKRVDYGKDVRLSMEHMGKHIYVTDSRTKIAVPYHNDVPLPIGFTVVIINNGGGAILIDGDGGGLTIIVPGVASGQYWDLAGPGMATLIKVDESTWFMTGNVTLAD